MNEVIRQLTERKSVRQYTEREISEQDKRLILESALQAPTAGNMMLYSILDIQDDRIKRQLALHCDDQKFIAQAKMVLVFLIDWSKWVQVFDLSTLHTADFMLAAQDVMAAAQNTVVCAESLGIGSCYIGDILENYEKNRTLLQLPEYVVPFSMLVFGYPTDGQKCRKKPARFLLKDIVHVDRYDACNKKQALQMIQRQSRKTDNEIMEYLEKFYHRKMGSPFRKEMIRSVDQILKDWNRRRDREI